MFKSHDLFLVFLFWYLDSVTIEKLSSVGHLLLEMKVADSIPGEEIELFWKLNQQ